MTDAAHKDGLWKARLVAEAALDRKGEDVSALDVREIASFADAFVIVTGTSDRHVRSLSDAIVEALSDAGEPPLGVEGTEEGRWVLIDANDVIVHVFLRDVREHYDIERLWSDAPVIDLPEPGVERATR